MCKNVNEQAFDSIDTEEKAYWLGFIFADGNISKCEYTKRNGKTKRGVYRIEVSLMSSDLAHLQKLGTFLELKKEIPISQAAFRKERARLMFSSKLMWTVLNSYGCTPCKSLTLTFPKVEVFKSKDLIKHFIRGYVDGDGCISYLNNTHKSMFLKLLGTQPFLTTLQSFLPLERPNKLFTRKGINVSELSFSNWRGYYICNYLYKDATIYLDRKYTKYKEYCRLYEES